MSVIVSVCVCERERKKGSVCLPFIACSYIWTRTCMYIHMGLNPILCM